MINRFSYKKVTWLDIVSPTGEEIREMVDETGIPAAFLSDLTTMTPRTETLTQKGAIKITLDFPIVKRTDINHPHEVKMIATKEHLITIRFEDMEAFHSFAKEFEVVASIDNGNKQPNGEQVLVVLLGHLYGALNNKLDYVESKMSDIEENIFNDREKEMLIEISRLSRRLITFKQVLKSHRSIVEELSEDIKTAFTARSKTDTTHIEQRYEHVTNRAEILAQTIEELRNTNTGLLSSKQNEIMKILTIMAFITFPLTLFTSMFGMNTTTTPIIGEQGDFWIIVSIMLVVSVGFFGFFKYKKWM